MATRTSRDVENLLRSVFKRCVKCPPDQTPACPPSCPAGEMCIQVPASCDVCASTKCASVLVDPSSPSSTSLPSRDNSSGPNVGAIAGGVVGGIAFVTIMVFCVWKFYLKGRRRTIDEGEWQEVDFVQEKTEPDFASRRSARASTHTVASMASSVLTRASNIIQIAYIPGVTNRSGPGSPDLLVPPVPPIPIMTTSSSALSSPYSTSEQHFFVPDLRDSTYSGTTTDGRSSYARTSIAPSLARSSVATTIYRNNAIVSPLPAQTIVRGKAAVVSVKSSGSSSPAETPGAMTPPVPQIDPKHTPSKPVRVQVLGQGGAASTPQSSIGSTSTLGPVKALTITKKKGADSTPPKSFSSSSSDSSNDTALVPPVRPLTDISLASSDYGSTHSRAHKLGDIDSDSDSDTDDHARARRSLLRTSSNPRDSDITEIQDTPGMLQSPFSDASQSDSPVMQQPRHLSTTSGLRSPLTPVMEESSKRGSRASKRTQSPFSDDNEVSD